MKKLIILFFLVIIFAAVPEVFSEIKYYDYEVIKIYPHDSRAFTQGLEYYNGFIYEGTGLYGESKLRKIDLKSAEILKEKKLPDHVFGEGITILNEKIYQLSWKENTTYVYDMDLKLINKLTYSGEGWGLTNDGKYLIMSNGSNIISYRDPKNFSIVKTIEVKNSGKKVVNLNELEFINGEIFANVWFEDYILRIDAKSGNVNSIIDLKDIIDPSDYTEEINVLNGIAYNEESKSLYITGKLWPHLFEIKIIE